MWTLVIKSLTLVGLFDFYIETAFIHNHRWRVPVASCDRVGAVCWEGGPVGTCGVLYWICYRDDV